MLGADAIMPVGMAVELLPKREADVRAWLYAAGLVTAHPVLGEVVIWADVVAEVRRARPVEVPSPNGPPIQIERAGLKRR
jgi:hypothetical protein